MRPHNPKATAFIRKWHKCMAIGCSHGDLAYPERLNEVIAFRERFKPEIRFDLGDLMDTAAFRSGARGTKDESQPIGPDNLAAVEWMRRYEPTHITWGNHDWRLVEWQGHQNEALSFAASIVWGTLQDEVKRLQAWQTPYHITKNWIQMGGYFWGHGTMFGENALRDHAEMLGGPVVHAHTHRAETVHGRTKHDSTSFSVGTLADVNKMKYADRQRSKTRWGAGVVFGEMCGTESTLWLARNKTSDEVEVPYTELIKPPTGADGWQTQDRKANPIIFPPGC
tara:strand:- start:343 stop:1185 length:843 start_codon:yes stop_codon:yes gene_type:complete